MPPLEQPNIERLSSYLPSLPLSEQRISRKKEKRKEDEGGGTHQQCPHLQNPSKVAFPSFLPSIPLLSEPTPRNNKRQENEEEEEEEKVTRRRQPNKKRVSFYSSVKCHYIKSHTEISEHRKNKLWYSRSEAAKIRKEAIDTVRKMADNKPLGRKETARGLENKTPKQFGPRVKEIREIIGFVLEEQSRFFTPVIRLVDDHDSDEEGGEEVDDPQSSSSSSSFTNDEYLGAVYRYYNKKHVTEAIRLAAIDAKEVWGV